MIGSHLFVKRAKLRLFMVLYGILGLGGVGFAALYIAKGEQVPTAAGFMLVFGFGMSWLTWSKGKKPLIVVREEFLELHFQRRPEFIVYKSISTVSEPKNGRLVVAVRDGHDIKNVPVWLRELEPADAERLRAFLQGKGWKRG